MATACTFAERNIGIAIVNERLAKQNAKKELILIPLVPKITHEYGFMTSAHAPMNRLMEFFYRHCKTYFKTYSKP